MRSVRRSPVGIDIDGWVAVSVQILVQGRRIVEIALGRVFAQEAPDVRVVEAGLEVIESCLVALVAGEAEGVAAGADAAAAFAPGIVFIRGLDRAVGPHQVADTSEAVEEVELASFGGVAHREETIGAVVVLGDGRSCGVGL
jgi:hypothetical protein